MQRYIYASVIIIVIYSQYALQRCIKCILGARAVLTEMLSTSISSQYLGVTVIRSVRLPRCACRRKIPHVRPPTKYVRSSYFPPHASRAACVPLKLGV